MSMSCGNSPDIMNRTIGQPVRNPMPQSRAVKSARVHNRGNAQECGGGQEIACDGQTVLGRRDPMTHRLEIGFRPGSAGRAIGNHECGDHDHHEHADCDPIGISAWTRRGRLHQCSEWQRGHGGGQQKARRHWPNFIRFAMTLVPLR
jgi:hypothetical protein